MEGNNCTKHSNKNTPFIISKPDIRFLPPMTQPEYRKETVRLENSGYGFPFRLCRIYKLKSVSLMKNKCDINHKFLRRRSLLTLMNFSVFIVTSISTKIVSTMSRIFSKLTLMLFLSHILAIQGIEARPTLETCVSDLTSIERPPLETFSALLHQMIPLQDLLKDICHKSPNSWQKLYNQARAIDVYALELQKEILLFLEEEHKLKSSTFPEAAPIKDPAGSNGHLALTPPPLRPDGRTQLVIKEPLDGALEEASIGTCSCDCKACCPDESATAHVVPKVIETAPLKPECPTEKPLKHSSLPEDQPESSDISPEISKVKSKIVEPLPAPAAVIDHLESPQEFLEPIPVLSVVIIDTMPILSSEVLNEVKYESTIPPTTIKMSRMAPSIQTLTLPVTTDSTTTTTVSISDEHFPTTAIKRSTTITPLIQTQTTPVMAASTTTKKVTSSETPLPDMYTTTKIYHQLRTLAPQTSESDKPHINSSDILNNNVVNDEPVIAKEEDRYNIYDENTEDSIMTDDEYSVTYADEVSTISPEDTITDTYDYYYITNTSSDTHIAPDPAIPLGVTPMWSDDATSYIIIDYDIKPIFSKPDLDLDTHETTVSSSKNESSRVVPDQNCFCPCSCSDPDATSLTIPLKSTLQTTDITKMHSACSVPLFNHYITVILIINIFISNNLF
ncbi:unnamed protein product [Meganyctiphanes norvegica]|uniref:Uncharacterized protein n=1 Tax=Meganyctiphanes norvegica TaxID=48144 RepID=A0AAV2QV47_MEGNR